MSDFAQSDHRSRFVADPRRIESRAMYGAFYTLALTRAALKRMLPRRAPAVGARETIFGEARTAASVMVASVFTGL